MPLEVVEVAELALPAPALLVLEAAVVEALAALALLVLDEGPPLEL